jgi:hypothetical protein
MLQSSVLLTVPYRETFVNRFSDEFKKGTGIDELMEAERNELYFSSSNDANEGGLGSWRRGQVRRPAETLHKFNATFKATQNETESFISKKLTEDTDNVYLMQTARQIDANRWHKKRKIAQIEADEARAMGNRQKEVRREEKRDNRVAVLLETSKSLVLDDDEIDKLTNDELNRQLDYHRDAEKKLNIPDAEKIPLKTHLKYKDDRRAELKKAVGRHVTRTSPVAPVVQDNDVHVMSSAAATTVDDEHYLSDHNDDLV